jgi:hypothetical protein
MPRVVVLALLALAAVFVLLVIASVASAKGSPTAPSLPAAPSGPSSPRVLTLRSPTGDMMVCKLVKDLYVCDAGPAPSADPGDRRPK